MTEPPPPSIPPGPSDPPPPPPEGERTQPVGPADPEPVTQPVPPVPGPVPPVTRPAPGAPPSPPGTEPAMPAAPPLFSTTLTQPPAAAFPPAPTASGPGAGAAAPPGAVHPGPAVFPASPPLAPAPPVVPPPWDGRPAPPPPPAPTPPNRARTVVIVALVVLIALVAAALVVAARRRDDDSTAPTTVPPTTEAPGTTETPGTSAPTTTSPPTQLDAVVDEVLAFVEQERGLDFRERPVVELLGEGAFQERLLADFEENVPELEDLEGLLTALGAVEAGTDLVEAMRGLLAGAVVGFYDSETNELVVRGADPTPYVRQVMAHELTHALDDQWFELERPELDEADDESDFGFTAVVEGNARRVEGAYFDQMSAVDQAQAQAEELMLALGIDVFSIPEILVTLLNAPYVHGPGFVNALLERGGQALLDETFGEPPTTSEQILEPDAYFEGDERIDVPAPEADGEPFDEGVLGQLLLTEVLDLAINRSDADEAAAGWGGDWYVAWRTGGETCVRATVVGDSAGETAALADAIQAWADETGADVEAGGDGVTFTRCA